jgi:hypothetical protein
MSTTVPGTGNPLRGALADEETVAGAPHVLTPWGGVPDGRGLVALAALHHVLQSKNGIVKELKGQCHKLKVPDGHGIVALAALHHVLKSKRGMVKEKPLQRLKSKGQCHKLKVPDGRGLVALAALHHVLKSKRG